MMKIKVHGSRGSFPISTPQSRVEEIVRDVFEFSQKKKIKDWKKLKAALSKEAYSLANIYGGCTTCVELNSDNAPMPIFFDAGTGLTVAGLDPESSLADNSFKTGKGKLAFFMSHTHWDHIIGLPTLEQLYRVGNEFHFFGVHKKLDERLANLFIEDHFPVPYKVVAANFRFTQIKLNESIEFGKLKVSHFPQSHPGGSFAYRIEDKDKVFVFATDTELKNINAPHMEPGKSPYSNADAMILDAQYSPEDIRTKEGYGHSSIHSAVDFAVREHCKHLYLFHQSPNYTDQAIDEQLEQAIKHHKKTYGSSSSMKISMCHDGLTFKV